MEAPQYEPITTLGKQGDYWEDSFVGSFWGCALEVAGFRLEGIGLRV